MGKIVSINPSQKIEAEYVDGVYHKISTYEQKLYNYCRQYFDEKAGGLFFAHEDARAEIFQNSFVKLWEIIEERKIYVEEGVLKGKDGQPLSCTLTTYFMRIAKIKYLEFVRSHPLHISLDDNVSDTDVDRDEYIDLLYGREEDIQLQIIADCISHMSARCNEILVKFYYEEKDLDTILVEIPSIESKNALKTKKFKCMEALREAVNTIYNNYLNH